MTAPTPYALAYDFTSYQSANPSSPLPADKIEIEFNAISTTTDEIITNLGLIQRSDGELANESVGEDQLSAGILAILGAGTGEISTLAALDTEISALYAIRANITTVAGISANVTTVAGISANVTTVAGLSSAIGTVNSNASNINTVAGISANVTTVAGIQANVTTVAGISANVTTVAGKATEIAALGPLATEIAGLYTIRANITTVAGMNSSHLSSVAGVASGVAALGPISANITTVAGIQANVTTVAGLSTEVAALGAISADLTALAAVDTEITTLAAVDTEIAALGAVAPHIQTVSVISAAVTTVSSGMTNVNTVAGIASEVEIVANYRIPIVTVAGIASDISTVAELFDPAFITSVGTLEGISSEIVTVAGISADVAAVENIAANVTTVAGISANVTTVAGISANVTTVAGISANVTSVAGNSANINTVATNIANVNAVGAISANVTTVAGIAADVTTVADGYAYVNIVGININEIVACADDINGDNYIGAVGLDLLVNGYINDVGANLANITIVAGIDADVTTVAGIAADVTTVAGMTVPLSAAIAGLDIVATATVATTADLSFTYANGTAGVGATLTAAGNGVVTIDGVNIVANNIILVKDQTNPEENGPYLCTTEGDVSTTAVFTRITNFDTAAELLDGSCVQVTSGATSAGMIFILDPVVGGFVMGTNDITFTQLSLGSGGGTAYIEDSNSAPTTAPFVHSSATDSLAIGNAAYIGATGDNSIAVGWARTVGQYGFSVQTGDNSTDDWGAAALQSVVIGPGYVEAGSDYSVVIGSDGYGNIVSTSTGCVIFGRGDEIATSDGCAIIQSGNSTVENGDTDIIIGGSSHKIGFGAASYGYNAIVGGTSTWMGDVSACVALGGHGNSFASGTDNSIGMGGTTVDASNMVGFPAIGKGQTSLYIQGQQTTDATPAALASGSGNGSPIPIVSGDLYVFKVLVGAASSSQSAAYEFTGAIRNIGGTTALVGSVSKTVLAEDDAAWDCDVTADNTNDRLLITVTGKAATTIKWCASTLLTRVY